MSAHACRAVCPVCLDPVLVVGIAVPYYVDPEPCPAQGGPGNVLVRKFNGRAEVLDDWTSDRTVVDQGGTVRFRLHRCHRHSFRFLDANVITLPVTRSV